MSMIETINKENCYDVLSEQFIQKAEYRVEAKQANASVSGLPTREIFCRKKEKIENLTYFERLEVLYDGVYFSADGFAEYGNPGLILEKKETKITTQDKAFALKHEFVHRELLCGESAYCKRYYCSLDDADITLAERTVNVQDSKRKL